MSDCRNIDKILERNGTSQGMTFSSVLNPNSIQLHDLDQTDWIMFAYNLAQHINFFDLSNDSTPNGNWQDFFKAFGFSNAEIPNRNSRAYYRLQNELNKIIQEQSKEGTLTPHLCLFTCFLYLLNHSQKRMNGLTSRHLDFYYNQVLGVSKLPSNPDEVHVLFELAKKTVNHKLDKGSLLNAKKDSKGVQREFAIKDEIVVNQSQVEHIKTLYHDGQHKEIKVSEVARTLDGVKKELPETAPYWMPFGYNSTEENFEELAGAKPGFTLASNVLGLADGRRYIYLTVNFSNPVLKNAKKEELFKEDKFLGQVLPFSKFPYKSIVDSIEVQCTGKKGWFKPNIKNLVKSGKKTWTTKVDSQSFTLVLELPPEMESLLAYNEEVYQEGYPESSPMLQFKVDTSSKQGYALYKELSSQDIASISLEVDVKDSKNCEIENDFGKLKPGKPFYPFTPSPSKDSNFYVSHNEALSKNWSRVTVNAKWKNAPESLANHYAAYAKGVNATYFKANVFLESKKQWQTVEEGKSLFGEVKDDDGKFWYHNLSITETNEGAYSPETTGFMKLTLQQSFLQEVYPSLLALSLNDAFTKANPGSLPTGTTLLEPYIPEIEEISVSYQAKEELTIAKQVWPITKSNPISKSNSAAGYENKKITLFHEHPFGFAEEHNYLEIRLRESGVVSKEDGHTISSRLIPSYCQGGNLYIGLSGAKPSDNISLLIQVLEGTENPLVTSFGKNEKIEWSVLCSNRWKFLDEEILSDNTGNFLKSGIVKLQIPDQATKSNTLMPNGMVWLRAKMHRAYNAVCKAVDIHTNAVRSEYVLKNPEAEHLKSGLEANTISKLMQRIPQIKGVEQPYNSYGGSLEEGNLDFYRRISERLRHKNRAITLWDYEHLILQEFDEIHKAKCLNHTRIAEESGGQNSYFAPGHVTVVVVPETKNRNVYDIYQPRVSKALLNEVQSYVDSRTGKWIECEVINPIYEEIKVGLEVEFIEGKDANYYQKQLEEDITKFLSPWAYDSDLELRFGQQINQSVLVSYVEKLEYVDYIQMVQIFKDGSLQANVVKPSNPAAILVSAKEHAIGLVPTNCKGEKEDEEVLCKK